MTTLANNEITIQETYNDIAFLSKLASLENCPSMLPSHVLYAKHYLSRLKGSKNVYVKYERKMYKITDSIKEGLGRFWPRNTEYQCYQNMYDKLRRILLMEEYEELDMLNAQSTFLSGFFPDAHSIARYISERDGILKEVEETAGVDCKSAKELLTILMFGGSVTAWRLKNNVSQDVRILPFVRDLEEEIKILQATFLSDTANMKYLNAAEDKRYHNPKKQWENSAFALWYQDLEPEVHGSLHGIL